MWHSLQCKCVMFLAGVEGWHPGQETWLEICVVIKLSLIYSSVLWCDQMYMSTGTACGSQAFQPTFNQHFFRFWSCWLVVGFEGDHWRSMPSALTCRMCTCRAKVSSCKHWSSGVPLMQVTLGNMGAIPFCFHWILAICCSGDWQNVTSSEDSYRYSDKKSERSA